MRTRELIFELEYMANKRHRWGVSEEGARLMLLAASRLRSLPKATKKRARDKLLHDMGLT